MDLDTLLNQPESKTLEFKRDLSSLTPILKTIVAFANTAGGILIIGRSAEGVISGIKDVFKSEETLANSISDSIRPSILPEIEIATKEGKDLIIVKVPHWRAPFYLKSEGIPNGVYIRLGSTSRPAGPELIAELQRSMIALSFDQNPLPDLPKEALDLELAADAFRNVGKKINEEKLRTLGALTTAAHRVVPSIGGMILFGKKSEREKALLDTRIRCARFQGDSKTIILDRLELEGPILDAIHEVPKFISRNTRLAAQINGMRRKDVPEYPPVAIREALINALAHSDYSLKGSHIQIAIYSNRLEIQSPGMLPFGFTLEDLKAGVSRVRNRVIARVFHELELMEEWGSGYKRILETCHEGGYSEPKWEELGNCIRVTFYPHPQTQLPRASTDDIIHTHRNLPPSNKKRPFRHKPELLEAEIELLSLFKQSKCLPFREISKKTKSALSERMIHYYLAKLKKKGLLSSKGKGRATVWQKKPQK
ncbi:MAG: putative DNA binding domain-containing protein [Rhabdochlamydiaceae bacterium]|nr:putative DNA binding domain-containing protein [Rhabdochlamydiaceae bacterium]